MEKAAAAEAKKMLNTTRPGVATGSSEAPYLAPLIFTDSLFKYYVVSEPPRPTRNEPAPPPDAVRSPRTLVSEATGLLKRK